MAATRDEYCKELKKELKLDDNDDIHFNSKGVLIIELYGSYKIPPQLNKFKLEYDGPLEVILNL